MEWPENVDGERAVGRQISRGGFAVRPEAVVKNLGHDAAVRVIPTHQTSAVTGVESILKNCLMLVEGFPLVGGWIA